MVDFVKQVKIKESYHVNLAIDIIIDEYVHLYYL